MHNLEMSPISSIVSVGADIYFCRGSGAETRGLGGPPPRDIEKLFLKIWYL